MKPPLSHIRVLVTRPAAQAGNLCDQIEAAGGQALRFPVMEIAPPSDMALAQARFSRLAEYQVLIFISTNAVEHGLKYLPQLPDGIKVAAVGPATLRALEARHVAVAIKPEAPFNSESLLSHPALDQPTGLKILIVRGEGGREELADQLRLRGAQVDYAEVYRQRIPDIDPKPLIAAWIAGGIDIVTVSSNQILGNLLEVLGPENHSLLRRTPLLAWGPRIMQITDTLNLSQAPLIAARSDDDGVVETLIQWANSTRHTTP